MIEQLWAALEDAQDILEELLAYVEVGEDTGKNEAFKKSETIKKDVQRTIEARQSAIKVRVCKYEHAIKREHDGLLRAIGLRRSAKLEPPQPQRPKPIFEAV